MNIKKNYLNIALIAILILSTSHAFSQKKEKKKEDIYAHKIAFITERLDLTPDEAEKFWPLYNSVSDAIQEQHNSMREKYDFEPDEIHNLSDKEANEFIQKKFETEQNILNLEMKLVNDLQGVISPQKILMLHHAEHEFRIGLIEKLKGQHQGKHGGPPPFVRHRSGL